MLTSLLKWLGPWLLKQLIPVLDPDAAERAKALDAKIAAIEEREREAAELQRKSDEVYAQSQKFFQESEQRRLELQRKHGEILAEIGELEEAVKASEARRKEIRSESEQAKTAIDNASDADILGGALPGSGSKTN